jgi:anti-sigma factor RsiW
MTCRELVDFLMDYQAGELAEPERDSFDRHLSVCPPCRAYLDSYLKTIEMGRRAFEADEEEVPPSVPDDLVRAILAARRKS